MIERLSLRPLRTVKGPAAMITTIGVSYVLFNIILLTVGGIPCLIGLLGTIIWMIRRR